MSGGLVYYKAPDRIVCRDLETGRLVWMGRRNRYQPDQMSLIFAQQNGGGGGPVQPAEMMLFGDRVHQGMTVSDGMLFNIEGDLFDGFSEGPRQPQQPVYGYGFSPRRTRRNWLAAYNAVNGKLRWYRNAQTDEHGGKFDVGFLAAPVPFARFLIVPVSDNGALWLYALEKKTGDLVWKTFLCEDPTSGANPWSPVAVAIDGGDAYVSTGAGVIFAVESLSGTVRWAVRYERTGGASVDNRRLRYGIPSFARISGWDEDTVIPHGKHLVVMASDCDELFALDRRSGELLWESPRTPTGDDPPGEYCLGLVGDGLFVAGKNVVRRYDIPSGRLLWQARLDASLGRGALDGQRRVRARKRCHRAARFGRRQAA